MPPRSRGGHEPAVALDVDIAVRRLVIMPPRRPWCVRARLTCPSICRENQPNDVRNIAPCAVRPPRRSCNVAGRGFAHCQRAGVIRRRLRRTEAGMSVLSTSTAERSSLCLRLAATGTATAQSSRQVPHQHVATTEWPAELPSMSYSSTWRQAPISAFVAARSKHFVNCGWISRLPMPSKARRR